MGFCDGEYRNPEVVKNETLGDMKMIGLGQAESAYTGLLYPVLAFSGVSWRRDR